MPLCLALSQNLAGTQVEQMLGGDRGGGGAGQTGQSQPYTGKNTMIHTNMIMSGQKWQFFRHEKMAGFFDQEYKSGPTLMPK